MAQATVAQLTEELVSLAKSVPSIGIRGFSVFNVEDLETIAGHVGFPLAGVSYEGGTPQEHSVKPKASGFKAATIVTLHFLLTVGTNYKYASDIDSKPVATDLLDEVRKVVIGYKGINNRPWRYTGEIPLSSDIEGVIFYGQMWETDIPVIGNSPN